MGTVAPFPARSKELGLVPPMLEPRVAVEELGAQPVRESAVSTPHTASEQFIHMSPP